LSPSILVIEDDPVIQELLAFNLKQSGYRLVQALDAASAMKHINCALPDLILLDIIMPRPNGYEVLRRLK